MFTRRLATYIEHKKMGGGEGESTSSIKNQQLHHPIVLIIYRLHGYPDVSSQNVPSWVIVQYHLFSYPSIPSIHLVRSSISS